MEVCCHNSKCQIYPIHNLNLCWLQALPKCNELFTHCYWKGVKANCCSEIFSLQRSEEGFCYAFNSLTSESVNKSWLIKMMCWSSNDWTVKINVDFSSKYNFLQQIFRRSQQNLQRMQAGEINQSRTVNRTRSLLQVHRPASVSIGRFYGRTKIESKLLSMQLMKTKLSYVKFENKKVKMGSLVLEV